MELKSRSLCACSSTFLMYQSYLYGIEIAERTLQAFVAAAYQSYLYGIEITLCNYATNIRLCINRTFMELKYYIVGLKEKEQKVSIVPLWN